MYDVHSLPSSSSPDESHNKAAAVRNQVVVQFLGLVLGILSSTPVSVSMHAPLRSPACSNPCPPQPLILFFLPRAVMSQEAPWNRCTPAEPTVETWRILGVGHAGEPDVQREPRRGEAKHPSCEV